MKKRLLSIIMCLIIFIGAMPAMVFAEEISTASFLTFKAQEANSSVTLNCIAGSDIKYSVDVGEWVDYTNGTAVTLENIGDTVSFKGNNVKTNDKNHFSITGKVAASGDVTSLTNSMGGNAALTDSCYNSMFYQCEGLTSAPALPSTQLAKLCYANMFSGCTSLESASKLPAEVMAERCYVNMFLGCINLKTAPELPAKTLAKYCYTNMFSGCTSLTQAPVLPATVMEPNCYQTMFADCTGLKAAPALPAQTLATYCYLSMFSGCTALTRLPELPAKKMVKYCYYNMFLNCTGIKLYENGSGESWQFPEDAEPDTNATFGMFNGIGGNVSSTGYIGVVYYYAHSLKGNCYSFGSDDQVTTLTLTRQFEETPAYTTTVTGKSGSYSFAVDCGTYTLRVSKTKHAPREYTITIDKTNVTQDVSIMLYGDVDGNGEIDNKDATQIKRYFNSLSNVIESTTDEAKKAYLLKVADVNSSGEIDNIDATQIKRFFNELSSVFDSIS